MKKDIEYYKRNMEIASDIVAKHYKIRDNFLMNQASYRDLYDYIVNTCKVLLPPKAHVLEVSCGTGILAEMLLKAMPDISLDVSDISGETLKLVRKKTKRFGNRIRFIKKDNSTYSFKGQYDGIYTTNAMRISFVDYSKLYLNFYKILKKNGLVLIGEGGILQNSILTKLGDVLNNVVSEEPTRLWRKFGDSKEFAGKINRDDISKVVEYYPPKVHIARLKKAGFRETRVIYYKYTQVIIAGIKGNLTFRDG